MRKLFIGLSVIACVLASACFGLSLSPYLAKRLGFAAFKQVMVEREAIPVTLVELISSAKESIVLSTDTLDNLTVLKALAEAGSRKVGIAVVLSGPTNPKGQGANAWLTDKGIPVRETILPIQGTILVIDKATVANSASGVLSKSGLLKEQSVLFVFNHKQTAESFFEYIRRQGKN